MRWFRDFALEKRITHIIHCAERSEWPVGKSYSAYTGCQGMDLDIPLYETVKLVSNDTASSSSARGSSSHSTVAAATAAASAGASTSSASGAHGAMGSGSSSLGAPDVITITTDQGGLSKQLSAQMNAAAAAAAQAAVNQQLAAAAAASAAGVGSSTSKKRKRHIAIDVETERAKLHALLNSTQSAGNCCSIYDFSVYLSTIFVWFDLCLRTARFPESRNNRFSFSFGCVALSVQFGCRSFSFLTFPIQYSLGT